MTSPITHEKIIEALRRALEDVSAAGRRTEQRRVGDSFSMDGYDEIEVVSREAEIADAALETARDLYQRLQAEKEAREDVNASYMQEIGAGCYPLPDDPRIDRSPHVAPPASANAGTGRATGVRVPHHLGWWRGKVNAWTIREEPLPPVAPDGSTLSMALGAASEEIMRLREALVSEHQRGLAEGERIGIEKSAKDAADKVADRIRIPTNTGDPQT